MKYLFTLAIAALMSFSIDASAQDALYSKADFEKILLTYDEIVVEMPGYNYKYVGNWLATMAIVGDHTLTFSRGRVVHSYDLSKVMFVQEEGKFVKLWFR